MTFFTKEETKKNRYTASINLNEFLQKEQVYKYKLPDDTIPTITKRLNELLPDFQYRHEVYRGLTYHSWIQRRYLINITISIEINKLIGNLEVHQGGRFSPDFVERVKKIVQGGDTSETFFTKEETKNNRYTASIDLDKFLQKEQEQVITYKYKLPDDTIPTITKRLNELLPGFQYRHEVYRDITYHTWIQHRYSINITISIEINKLIGNLEVMAGFSPELFTKFVERVKKIVQGDTSDSTPFRPVYVNPFRPERRIELTPIPKQQLTPFQEYTNEYAKCDMKFFSSMQYAHPHFREFNIETGNFVVAINGEGGSRDMDHAMRAYGYESSKRVVNVGTNVSITEELLEHGFRGPSNGYNATLFHIIIFKKINQKDTSHLISGFITSNRVVVLHQYRVAYYSQSDDYFLTYLSSLSSPSSSSVSSSSTSTEVPVTAVIFPVATTPKEYDIQKIDNRISGHGLCQRWFLVFAYAVATKLGNNKANWDALGDTWAGSLVKEVYDEINANPMRALYKATEKMPLLSGGRRKTRSQRNKRKYTRRH